ncbi:hypothetical protein RUMCAL_02180 [Ruminococcus callidus ATCC 27760]|uniref:Uncharacterized protein n=1 Tax=Ruminococcus callidus ATCC 27760 TaxID=411473 RepID=U2KNW2_9FIRM|nr:hypothetical protein RUMCAL_02180 [Ruminococcus callidus ATCC 27760]
MHAICVQIFPSYCPEIPCHNNGSLPAEFLSNLPKNLTTHLTHKLYSVFPKNHYRGKNFWAVPHKAGA